MSENAGCGPVRLVSASPEQTRSLGRAIGTCCRGGEVIVLDGDLGAGKTTLAQGIAMGLGITAPVVSPTFIVLREYEGRLPLYHFDFYRLEGTDRAVEQEFDEYVYGHGVCVMEWAAYVPRIIPPDNLTVRLKPGPGSTRHVELHAAGAGYVTLLGAVRAARTDRGAPA